MEARLILRSRLKMKNLKSRSNHCDQLHANNNWPGLDSNEAAQPSLSVPAPEPTLSPLLSHSEIGGGASVPTKVQWPVEGGGILLRAM